MTNLSFVGKDQPEVKTEENATVVFKCQVSSVSEDTRECAVGFSIEELAETRFNQDLAGVNGLVPWYSYWAPVVDENGHPVYSIDDDRYINTDAENFKHSIASQFRLTYLELLGLRESPGYRAAIVNLPCEKFSEEQKQKLLTRTSFPEKVYSMDIHLFQTRAGDVHIHELVECDLVHVDTVHKDSVIQRLHDYFEECGTYPDFVETTEYIEKSAILQIVAQSGVEVGIGEMTLEHLIHKVKNHFKLSE